MKNSIKNMFYSTIGLALLSINNVNAAINPWRDVNADLRTADSADIVVQLWLGRVLGFLYIAAVIIAIWWGFNILTAAWDEEKVKTWKTVIIQAAIWIVVIFLAWSIIDWLLNLILV